MNMQELGVAQQYRLGVVVLVFNNGMWGTIRAHQEREFPAVRSRWASRIPISRRSRAATVATAKS